jgi:hypothetical protein
MGILLLGGIARSGNRSILPIILPGLILEGLIIVAHQTGLPASDTPRLNP